MIRMLQSIIVSMIVILFTLSISSFSANAAAREYFKCKLVNGATAEAMIELSNDFMKIARKEGFEDYSMELLWPLFAADISRGSFFWAGMAPNAERIGALNDFWENSDANADIRKRNRALTTCESSSLYMTSEIK